MDNEFIDKETLDQIQSAADKKKQEEENAKKAKKSKGPRKQNTLVQILNGDILNKDFVLAHFNFIFFILFLLMLIVGKGYYGKQLIEDVNTNQMRLDDISSDYIEKKANIQEETRRSSLDRKLEGTGIKETQNPTKVIRLKK